MHNVTRVLALGALFVSIGNPLLFAAVVSDIDSPGPRNAPVVTDEYDHTWHVSQATGSDTSGDGSRSRPWQSIAKALKSTADASGSRPHAILIAQGVYEVDELPLQEHVDCYGGYDSETWNRDICRFETVLSGGKRHRVLVGADDATLDGFTIRDGAVRGRGAALLCVGCSPTVTNNRFVGNMTLAPPNWNPPYLHERAHDGGAICVCDEASPTIANNLFVGNRTAIGRGAAIALHGRCGGAIRNNVFLSNTTGTQDTHRSSDGGAVSVFAWSNPRIEGNDFIENKALSRNDAGALFTALWSSPSIVRNTFVGNQAEDDGGALFVGGQEHRYDRPKDPMPAQDQFSVLVAKNLFYGNDNSSHHSSGFRATMQARASFVNNIVSKHDQAKLQASELIVVNNTFLKDVTFEEFTSECFPQVVANNIFWGKLELDSDAPVTYSNLKELIPGTGNLSNPPLFEDDRRRLRLTSAEYLADRFVTSAKLHESKYDRQELAGRVVRAGDMWSVVKSNQGSQVVVWGDFSQFNELKLLPTYRLQPESPCIDQGTQKDAPGVDIQGDPRPTGKNVDIGADEFVSR